jgi:hypothetical protein
MGLPGQDVSGGAGHRYRGGDVQGRVRGQRHHEFQRDRSQFGVDPGEMAEVRDRRAYQFAVGARTDCHDRACRLGAGDQRQLHRVGPSLPVLQVHVVDPDPAVAYQHLAGRGNRVGPFGHHEFFRAAVPADLDRQHYRLRLIWAAGSSASPAAHRAWVNMACLFRWYPAAPAAVQTPSHGPLVRRGPALPAGEGLSSDRCTERMPGGRCWLCACRAPLPGCRASSAGPPGCGWIYLCRAPRRDCERSRRPSVSLSVDAVPAVSRGAGQCRPGDPSPPRSLSHGAAARYGYVAGGGVRRRWHQGRQARLPSLASRHGRSGWSEMAGSRRMGVVSAGGRRWRGVRPCAGAAGGA